jgi:predicted RNA-binding protein with PUA-like domain
MQEMKEGDLVLYYHSNANPSGVVGIARVCKEAYPDHYAFVEGHTYHDEKSDPDDPRWYMVDIEFVEKLPERVPLSEVKEEKALEDMELVRRMRLSVQSVKKDEFERIKKMGGL